MNVSEKSDDRIKAKSFVIISCSRKLSHSDDNPADVLYSDLILMTAEILSKTGKNIYRKT